jgi:hypothetical protein
MRTNTKPMVWGAVGGAVACMIAGFSWSGWVTESGYALTPDAVACMIVGFGSGGWVTGSYALVPGAQATDSDVARACAEMLAFPPLPKTRRQPIVET